VGLCSGLISFLLFCSFEAKFAMTFFIKEVNVTVTGLTIEWQEPSFLKLTSIQRITKGEAAKIIESNSTECTIKVCRDSSVYLLSFIFKKA